MAGIVAVSPAGAIAELTAGDVDDNLNFGLYLQYEQLPDGPGNWSSMPSLDLADRVTLRIRDGQGGALTNAWVRITATDAPEHSIQDQSIDLQAGADGVVRFFPTFDGLGDFRAFAVEAGAPGVPHAGAQTSLVLGHLDARREVSITVANSSSSEPTALDIMLVVDTTGSMGDEISYLAKEFSTITGSIAATHGGLDIRYGLVVYRDAGDAYTNVSYGFTTQIANMQGWLGELDADAGGDYPEAMDVGLWDGVRESWRGGNTARLMFLVADAPPHKEGYGPMIEAARAARQAGIHIFPLAASGVDTAAEYLMRASAVLTQGRYLFLTDDSGIGNGHAAPGAQCYVVTTLTNLFGRVIGSELTGERIEPAEADIIRTVGNYTGGQCEANGGVIRPYAAISRIPTALGGDGLEHPLAGPGVDDPAAAASVAMDPPSTDPSGGAAVGSGTGEPDTDTTSGAEPVYSADVYSTTTSVRNVGAPSVAPMTDNAADATGSGAASDGSGSSTQGLAGTSPGEPSAPPAASVAFGLAGGAAAILVAALVGAFAAGRQIAARRRAWEIWTRR